MTAVDDGGPTRHFLSEVWRQLGDLHGEGRDREGKIEQFELFSSSQSVPCSYIMQTNDFINSKISSLDDDEKMSRRIESQYEAVGRIILYVLGQAQEKDASLAISSQVLPKLYRNFLLRGIDPRDLEYPIEDLLQDVMAMVQWTKEPQELMDAFFSTYELDDEFLDIDDHDRKFRFCAYKQFIQSRSDALDAIQRGLTLNDRIDPTIVFEPMPLEAVDKFLFAKETIELSDVLECLTYFDASSVVLDAQRQILAFHETEGTRQVSGILPDLLRERNQTDSSFLGRFVFFVTAHRFIPSRNFKIQIEFTIQHDLTPEQQENDEDADDMSDEALPSSHACDSTLSLPFTAYDGNAEKFAQKLDQALEYVAAGTFDMT